jgi:hypothetical protein
MRLPKRLGMILLGIWLVATGLLQVVNISIPGINVIMAILAIAAGIVVLFGKAS